MNRLIRLDCSSFNDRSYKHTEKILNELANKYGIVPRIGEAIDVHIKDFTNGSKDLKIYCEVDCGDLIVIHVSYGVIKNDSLPPISILTLSRNDYDDYISRKR